MRLDVMPNGLVVITTIMRTLLPPAQNDSGAGTTLLPTKIIRITEGNYPDTNNQSYLYSSFCDVMTNDKIRFDVFNISETKNDGLLKSMHESGYADPLNQFHMDQQVCQAWAG